MGEARGKAAQEVVVDSIVMAFANSELKGLLTRDAFRSVLNLQYEDLFDDGTLDLAEVLDLLSCKPGFDATLAVAPLCRLKELEEEIGVSVKLPKALAALPEGKRAQLSIPCRFNSTDVRKITGKESAQQESARAKRQTRAEQRAKRQTRVSASPQRHAHTQTGAGWRSVLDSSTWRFAILAAGLIAVGFAGYTVYGEVTSGVEFEAMAIDLGEVPATDPERRGPEVAATLADSSWLSLPEETRRTQLETVLRGIEDPGVKVFFLRDEAGELVASARWWQQSDTSEAIDVSFY